MLVVDQCEEAVALCDDAGEQARFFAALAAHAERAPLVVALRADRLGELSAHPDFARLIEPGLYLLGAMGEADLRAAIEGPAHQAGLLLEPGLVELLVRDVEGEAGRPAAAVPRPAHHLGAPRGPHPHRRGLPRHRRHPGRGRPVGRGALRPGARRPATRWCATCSCAWSHPAPTGNPCAAGCPAARWPPTPPTRSWSSCSSGARLVTSDDGVVQLAHEALARAWPRLRGWLDEDVEGQRILRHLAGAADTWDAHGPARQRALPRCPPGRRHSTGASAPTPTSPPPKRAFLDAGQALADTERRAAENRARHQARQNRRLRALLTATAIFLVVSIVTGFVAVGQRERAEREGRVATARELAAAANANVDVDPERSILLALAAVERSRGVDADSVLPEAEEALHRAVTASRIELRVPGVGGRVDWSPDGTVFVTEGPEGSGIVDIRDARTGESVRSFRGHDGDINDVAFNHDGTLLATTGDDGAARIWDPATGEELHAVRVARHRRCVRGLGARRSAATARSSRPPGPPTGSSRSSTWRTGRVVREIRSVPSPTETSFDPTGTRLAIASESRLDGEGRGCRVGRRCCSCWRATSMAGHGRRLEPGRTIDRHGETPTATSDIFDAGHRGARASSVLGHGRLGVRAWTGAPTPPVSSPARATERPACGCRARRVPER